MKREVWWLIAILSLAALIRLALWMQPLHLPANDEVEYLTVARDLLARTRLEFLRTLPLVAGTTLSALAGRITLAQWR
jgi:hypothetical protein